MKHRTHLLIALILAAIVAVPLYYGLKAIYVLPFAASSQAEPIDRLFDAHFKMIAGLFSLIVTLMLYALVVYRRRPGDEGEGDYFHGHTGLEIAWTILPFIFVVGFGVWGSNMLIDITSAQENEMIVEVTGRQWSWSFGYPEAGDFSTQEMVVPVGQPLLLQMHSEDVLHSFWVPEFRIKQDLVPHSLTEMRITPTEIGEYKVRCAEICGFDHAIMVASVIVTDTVSFEEWLISSSDLPDATDAIAWGEKHYQDYGCAACHSTDGSKMLGPTWQGLYNRQETLEDGTAITADEDYIRTAIEDPALEIVSGFTNSMPADFKEKFDADANGRDVVADLIAFIQSLEAEQ